ncbi:MAG: hypothetical protein QM782_20185 [Pseudorhodoferax sp.]
MADAQQKSPRLEPPPQGWLEDLPLRGAPLSGTPDGQDEINHLDEWYLEFSMASDLPRGIAAVLGAIAIAALLFLTGLPLLAYLDSGETWTLSLTLLPLAMFVPLAWFLFRLDFSVPRDRPVRFNRRQGKVFINHYAWTHNPFGKWGGGVKVWDWNTVQACVVRRLGASGEVVTQHYDLLLVSCKPGTTGSGRQLPAATRRRDHGAVRRPLGIVASLHGQGPARPSAAEHSQSEPGFFELPAVRHAMVCTHAGRPLGARA